MSRNVIDLDRTAQFLCGGFHHVGQIQNRELFGELVVNAALAFGCGVVAGNLDTSDRVANVKETARLSALAVNGERLSDGGLNTKAIQHSTEDVVIVEAIDQRLIERGFVGGLVQYTPRGSWGGGRDPPIFVRGNIFFGVVVDLREVIKGAGLLRE